MEKKQEHLPLTKIGNTFFNIDMERGIFIKAGRPEHIVPIDGLIFKGTHYEMPWDLFTEKKALPHEMHSEDVIMARIPLFTQSAPAEMAEKYKMSIMDVVKRTDFDLAVNLELFTNRRNGMLPEMQMLDKIYQVDLKNNAFYNEERSYKLSDFSPDFNPEGTRSAYINKRTGDLVGIDLLKIVELPGEEVVKVTLPGANKLDPYHEAIRQGKDIRTYLMRYPPEEKTFASHLELKDTSLVKQVKHNQEREAQKASLAHEREIHRKVRNGIY